MKMLCFEVLTVQNARKCFIPAILLIILLSGCARQTGASTTTSGTTTASPANGGIVNTPIPTTGCGKVSPLTPGSTADTTINSGGLQRTYRLHIPTGYDPNQMTPLVFDIHGHGGTAAQQERYTQYSASATTLGWQFFQQYRLA